MSDSPLELIDVSKSFNDKIALSAFSLSVPQGGILGFLGPNGAGKSTSLRIALGILSPDQGDARLFGSPPSLSSLKKVGFLPEERGLYKKMSCRNIIAYFGSLKGMKRAVALDRADELLDEYGLSEYKNAKITKLSKGMAQKVQILSTLVHRPDLIILDEPFSGPDPVNQQDLEALIRSEHARGATIIFSTHVMEHAERLCDRLAVIGAGEKKFDGTINEAMALIPEFAEISTVHGYDLQNTLAPIGFTADLVLENENGCHWRIDVPVGQSAQDVLRATIDFGSPIQAFTPHKAKLRDVFVSLVGEDETDNVSAETIHA